MADTRSDHKRIIVVGGGVSGMAAAYRVAELAAARGTPIDVRVLEARDQLGGSLVTNRHDGFLVEAGPDSFITQKPWALALCKRLGLTDEIIPTNPAFRRTFVVRKGRLHPIPEGFLLLAPSRIMPFVTSRLFSWPGKLRMGLDLILPAKDHGHDGDESLASFVRRRFGREALERVAQPLVGGIYTADPEMLGLRATMPRFLEMEAEHRSLILGMRRAAKAMARASKQRNTAQSVDSGARYSMFVSLASGMSRLIEVLRSRLPADAIRTNAPVTRIAPVRNRWQVSLADGTGEIADGVILTCAAYHSAELVRTLDTSLADDLASIDYASSATMSLAYRREDVPGPLDGFGFVVPFVENRTLIAVTFNSVKFAGRAPDGWVLMRAFLGGAMQPEVYEMDDARLRDAVLRDLRDLLGIEAPPRFVELYRWPRSMPQYPVGHLHAVAAIHRKLATWPGLAIGGSAFGGVGIPDCVHSGETAAEAVVTHVAGVPDSNSAAWPGKSAAS
ncbi:MAG TPA: protoporphyrinogen oxidase [Phycisphaerae bacterium]|nr:protoporphyrinogen oxidase [Phycisphaerae bacterium]